MNVINPSKIVVDFGPNFPPYIYQVKSGQTDIPTDGMRILTKRQDNSWGFMGYGKLYSGDIIEFE